MNRIALEEPAVNPHLQALGLSGWLVAVSPGQVSKKRLEAGPDLAQLSLQAKSPLAGRPPDLRQGTLVAALGRVWLAPPAQEGRRRALGPDEVADRLVAKLDNVLGDLPQAPSQVRRLAAQVALSPGAGIPQSEEGPIDPVEDHADLAPGQLGIPQSLEARLERLVAGSVPAAQIGLGFGCPPGLERTEKLSENSHRIRLDLARAQGTAQPDVLRRGIQPSEWRRFSLCLAAILSYNG